MEFIRLGTYVDEIIDMFYSSEYTSNFRANQERSIEIGMNIYNSFGKDGLHIVLDLIYAELYNNYSNGYLTDIYNLSKIWETDVCNYYSN